MGSLGNAAQQRRGRVAKARSARWVKRAQQVAGFFQWQARLQWNGTLPGLYGSGQAQRLAAGDRQAQRAALRHDRFKECLKVRLNQLAAGGVLQSLQVVQEQQIARPPDLLQQYADFLLHGGLGVLGNGAQKFSGLARQEPAQVDQNPVEANPGGEGSQVDNTPHGRLIVPQLAATPDL